MQKTHLSKSPRPSRPLRSPIRTRSNRIPPNVSSKLKACVATITDDDNEYFFRVDLAVVFLTAMTIGVLIFSETLPSNNTAVGPPPQEHTAVVLGVPLTLKGVIRRIFSHM